MKWLLRINARSRWKLQKLKIILSISGGGGKKVNKMFGLKKKEEKNFLRIRENILVCGWEKRREGEGEEMSEDNSRA